MLAALSHVLLKVLLPMPRIFLTNETYIAANDESEIIGSAGTERVNLLTGVDRAAIASNIERLDLPGAIAEYTFSSFGAALTISTPTGQVIATVSDAGGKQIGFADGVQDVVFDPDIFTLFLGSVPLTGTASRVDPDSPLVQPLLPSNVYISGQGGNGVTSDFNIEVVFEGTFSTAERAAFVTAANYLSVLITGDLPDEGAIDDIRIIALLEPIDGPFNVLGFAGPTAYRSDGTFLPSQGEMTFDTADAATQVLDGTFTNTVVHEMIHALGFGTIWDLLSLVTSGTELRFTGDHAVTAYTAEFPGFAGLDPASAFGVPLESEGGHWSEELFTTEIMTPTLNEATDYMSSLTVASLEDLGYDTIFDIGNPATMMPQLDTFMLV